MQPPPPVGGGPIQPGATISSFASPIAGTPPVVVAPLGHLGAIGGNGNGNGKSATLIIAETHLPSLSFFQGSSGYETLARRISQRLAGRIEVTGPHVWLEVRALIAENGSSELDPEAMALAQQIVQQPHQFGVRFRGNPLVAWEADPPACFEDLMARLQMTRPAHLAHTPPAWLIDYVSRINTAIARTNPGADPFQVPTCVMIPNRRDPARRGQRAVRTLSELLGYKIETAVIYSDADAKAGSVARADHAIKLPGEKAAFMGIDGIRTHMVQALRRRGVTSLSAFLGWGFNSEVAAFVAMLQQEGVSVIGPFDWSHMAVGEKAPGKALARQVGVPVIEGSPAIPVEMVEGEPQPTTQGQELAWSWAQRLGFPQKTIMFKADAGGGGGGNFLLRGSESAKADQEAARQQFLTALQGAIKKALAGFKSPNTAIELYVEGARHVEAQVLADGTGRPEGVLIPGVRECSLQRRFQKLIELSMRYPPQAIYEAAVKIAAGAGIKGPSTIEFLMDRDGNIYFMEVNTRIQVEHTATEEERDIDLLVNAALIEMGLPPTRAFLERIARPPERYSMNLRILAEDPLTGIPSPGKITHLHLPSGPHVRVDTDFKEGDVISTDYDSMIAKVIVTGDTPEELLAHAIGALEELEIGGILTNKALHIEILRTDEMRALDSKGNLGAGITVTWFNDYLAARCAVIEGRRHELTGLQASLAEKYGDQWAAPLPYQDEALITVAVAAYHRERYEREQRIQRPDSTVPITREQMPSTDGLRFNAAVSGQSAEIQVREMNLSTTAVTVNGRTVLVEPDRVSPLGFNITILNPRLGDDRRTHFHFLVEPTATGDGFMAQSSESDHPHIFALSTSSRQGDSGMIASPGNALIHIGPTINPSTLEVDISTPWQVGDRVTAGQIVAVSEAMKNFAPIRARVTGTITRVYVQSGQTVGAGDPLLQIQPDEGQSEGHQQSTQPYSFAEKLHIGRRTALGSVGNERESTDDEIMTMARERLGADATSYMRYIGEYLAGWDYTEEHIRRLLDLIGEASANDELSVALVEVLRHFTERQMLYSEAYRDRFHLFLRNWRRADFEPDADLVALIRVNLAHFGIHFGVNERIGTNSRYPEHLLSNILMRIAQAWTNGAFRQQVEAHLIRLAGALRLRETQGIIRAIHDNARARGARPLVEACLEAAKEIDSTFHDEIVHAPVPHHHRAQFNLLQADVFAGFSEERSRMQASIERNEFVAPEDVQDNDVRTLAEAFARDPKTTHVRLMELYCPVEGFAIHIMQWQEGISRHETLLATSILAQTAQFRRMDVQINGGGETSPTGAIIGEPNIERGVIGVSQLVGMYNILGRVPRKQSGTSFGGHRVMIRMANPVRYRDDPNFNGGYSPRVLDRLGRNVGPFTLDKGLLYIAFLATIEDGEGSSEEVCIQYYALPSGRLVMRRIPPADFFVRGDSMTARQHATGKLTVEERARGLFDRGEYEVLRIDGVDQPARYPKEHLQAGAIMQDSSGRTIYQPNGIMIAVGDVNGHRTVACLGDFRVTGGAVGRVEGYKMLAASLYARLHEMPQVRINDSGGADINAGLMSLNVSAGDFGGLVMTGGDVDPEDLARWIDHHDDPMVRQITAQFIGKRRMIDHLRRKPRQSLHISLMAGAAAGMVVYGPALLSNNHMVDGDSIYCVLTGTNVVYQVYFVRETNYGLGGAPQMVIRAGTVDGRVATEDELLAIAKRLLPWLDPSRQETLDGIQRANLDGPQIAPANRTLTPELLTANADGGLVWHSRNEYLNSQGLTAARVKWRGRTVAILGPLEEDGFGTPQAVTKAHKLVRAAKMDRTPIVRVVGRNWFNSAMHGAAGSASRMAHLVEELATADVPQVTIITHPEGLTETAANVGSAVRIFVASPGMTESDRWNAHQANCMVVDTFSEACDHAATFIALTSPDPTRPAIRKTNDPTDRRIPNATTLIPQLVPGQSTQSIDMHALIAAIADDGFFSEVGSSTDRNGDPRYTSNQITGFLSLGGRVVGLLADQSSIRGGAADYWEAKKYAEFVRLCERLGIPLLDLSDSPGFPPGSIQEGADIQGEWANALKENILFRRGRVSFKPRRSYGGHDIVAGHKYLRPGTVRLVGEGAEVAVMGARGGAAFVRKLGIKEDYTTLNTSTAQVAQRLIEILNTLLRNEARDREDILVNALERLRTEVGRADDAFMRIDVFKSFVGTYRAHLPQPLSEVLREVDAEIEKGRALQERYMRQVGDPRNGVESGAVDKIIDLRRMRPELIAAFIEAEARAAVAWSHPWAVTTTDEALGHYAALSLDQKGIPFEWVADPRDPANTAKARLRIRGTAVVMTPADVMEVIGSTVQDSDLPERLQLYGTSAPAEKQRLIIRWDGERMAFEITAATSRPEPVVVEAILRGLAQAVQSGHGQNALALVGAVVTHAATLVHSRLVPEAELEAMVELFNLTVEMTDQGPILHGDYKQFDPRNLLQPALNDIVARQLIPRRQGTTVELKSQLQFTAANRPGLWTGNLLETPITTLWVGLQNTSFGAEIFPRQRREVFVLGGRVLTERFGILESGNHVSVTRRGNNLNGTVVLPTDRPWVAAAINNPHRSLKDRSIVPEGFTTRRSGRWVEDSDSSS